MAGVLDQAIAAALDKQRQRDLGRLQAQGVALDDPRALALNPTLAAILANTTQAPAASGIPMQMPTSAPTRFEQGLAAALSGVQTPTPRQQVQVPMAAQAQRPQQAPAQAQAQAPVQAPADGAGAADILAALSGGAGQQLPAGMPMSTDGGPAEKPSFYQTGDFYDLLLNTSLSLARGEGIGEALTVGVGSVNAKRQQDLQKQLLMYDLANKQSQTQLNTAQAQKALAEAGKVVKEDPTLEREKLKAETAKIKAETSLANVRAKVAQEGNNTLSPKEYNTAFIDLRNAIGEQDLLSDETDPNLFWSPDIRARIMLNETAGKEARFVPFNDNYKGQLSESKKALAEGSLTQGEYNARVQQAALAFGPANVLSYLKQLE